jgi:hypothetical protein
MKTKHKIKIFFLSLLLTKKGIRTFLKTHWHPLVFMLFFGCTVQPKLTRVQDYELNQNGHWQAIGEPHSKPDTLTIIHGYQWHKSHIIAIRDYKLVNGSWQPYGVAYPLPDTLKLIHAFIQ